MENFKLKLELESTDTSVPLGVRVYFDNNCIFETDYVRETIKINHSFVDDVGPHSFRVEMFGKSAEHTKLIDDKIVKDVLINVTHISIEDIDLTKLLWNKGVYRHSFNSSREPVDNKFFGSMGCNGSFSLTFESPFFIWMLENM